MRLTSLWLVAIFIAGCAPAPGTRADTCPTALAASLAPDRAECRLIAEGKLVSSLSYPEVAYQLVNWKSLANPSPSELYDREPYSQTAVLLAAGTEAPFAVFWTWQGEEWFETPQIVRNLDYGEFLVVPGRIAGTGSLVDDRVFLGSAGGWAPVASLEEGDPGTGWGAQLASRLPEGFGLWKGILVDYATLTGGSRVWRPGDANCCPTGGAISFRLRLAIPALRLEAADAQYLPEEQ